MCKTCLGDEARGLAEDALRFGMKDREGHYLHCKQLLPWAYTNLLSRVSSFVHDAFPPALALKVQSQTEGEHYDH